MKNLEFSGDTLLSTLDWPFSQLLECGTRIMEMNFILPHSFELDFPRVPLLSTLEVLLFDYSNTGLRKVFIRITLRRIYLNCHGILYSTDCSVVRIIWCSRLALVFVFLYGGNIPFVVSLCFASQRTPTVCAHCAGSISTIGLRSFLLQVSGVSSHLSFCCTSLVSGFIIHIPDWFVYSQSAQWIRHTFSRND